LPAPKLPVTDVAVITARGDKLPVPLIPIMLNSYVVVESATTELIAVLGTISPVAFIALRNPTVGLVVPPNAETVIEEVPVFVTNTVFPKPKVAVLPTAEIIELTGKSIAELNPVIVNVQGPITGALNVGIVIPLPRTIKFDVPVAVNACTVSLPTVVTVPPVAR
jgi:hypothetical protein